MSEPQDAAPPVVELVIGAQFSPLVKLTAGHFGLLWNELGPDWVNPADGPPLDDHFESFDPVPPGRLPMFELRLGPVPLPGRFTLTDANQERMLQVQATRFHFNWRRRAGFYPSYTNLIGEFESVFGRFESFVRSQGWAGVQVNQWELTYVDAFPKGEYWQTPADWSAVLPGLFGTLFPADSLGLALEHRAAQWSYEIQPKRGRLHVIGQPGRWGEKAEDVLLLSTTARGPVGRDGAATLREGLDIGHDAAVGTFRKVIRQGLQAKWGAA